MDAVHRSGQALLSLVEDIMSFMKIESGQCIVEHELCDIRQIVYDVAHMMTFQCEQKNVTLNVDYPTDGPHEVMASIGALRRILVNLVGNAVKFTESGRIDIQVRFETIGTSRDKQVVIVVKDTGFGIPKDKKAYIFERFTRLDPVYRGQFEGLVLGLSIVKNMFDRLGGTVSVDSVEGEGSTLTVTFLAGVPEENVQEAMLALASSRLRVLWLSDDAVVASELTQNAPVELNLMTQNLEQLDAEAIGRQPEQVVLVDLKDTDSACALAQRIYVPNKLFILLCHAGDQLNVKLLKQYGFFALFRRPLSNTQFAMQLKDSWDAWLLASRQRRIKAMHEVRVLLVENDLASQQVSAAMLEGFGCTVDVVSSGQEALTAYAESEYHIIFVDIGLGDMSGFDIARALREKESDLAHPVPIIALTAHVFQNYERQSIDAGMNDYLTKPVLQKDFEALLKKYIFRSLSNMVDEGS